MRNSFHKSLHLALKKQRITELFCNQNLSLKQRIDDKTIMCHDGV
jgi:hypothetical protein